MPILNAASRLTPPDSGYTSAPDTHRWSVMQLHWLLNFEPRIVFKEFLRVRSCLKRNSYKLFKNEHKGTNRSSHQLKVHTSWKSAHQLPESSHLVVPRFSTELIRSISSDSVSGPHRSENINAAKNSLTLISAPARSLQERTLSIDLMQQQSYHVRWSIKNRGTL